MEKKIKFNYSLKKYSHSSKTILSVKTYKIESVIKRMRWKVFFFLNGGDTKNNIEKETFGFKSKNCPAQIKELRDFEDDLFNIAKSIKYRETKYTFQRKMKEDIPKLKSSKNVYVLADKTTNTYEVPPDEYKKLLKENITKTYRKSPPRLEKALNLEAKQIA